MLTRMPENGSAACCPVTMRQHLSAHHVSQKRRTFDLVLYRNNEPINPRVLRIIVVYLLIIRLLSRQIGSACPSALDETARRPTHCGQARSAVRERPCAAIAIRTRRAIAAMRGWGGSRRRDAGGRVRRCCYRAALAFPAAQLTRRRNLRGAATLHVADREKAAEHHQHAEDADFRSCHRELLVVMKRIGAEPGISA